MNKHKNETDKFNYSFGEQENENELKNNHNNNHNKNNYYNYSNYNQANPSYDVQESLEKNINSNKIDNKNKNANLPRVKPTLNNKSLFKQQSIESNPSNPSNLSHISNKDHEEELLKSNRDHRVLSPVSPRKKISYGNQHKDKIKERETHMTHENQENISTSPKKNILTTPKKNINGNSNNYNYSRISPSREGEKYLKSSPKRPERTHSSHSHFGNNSHSYSSNPYSPNSNERQHKQSNDSYNDSPSKYKKTKHDHLNDSAIDHEINKNLNQILQNKDSGIFTQNHYKKVQFKAKPEIHHHTQIMFTDLKEKMAEQLKEYMNSHRFSTLLMGTKRFYNKTADFYLNKKEEEKDSDEFVYELDKEAFHYAMNKNNCPIINSSSYKKEKDMYIDTFILPSHWDPNKLSTSETNLRKSLMEKLSSNELIIELRKETLELSPIPKLKKKDIPNMSKQDLKNFEKAKNSSLLLRKLEFSTHVSKWSSGQYDKLVEDYLLRTLEKRSTLIQRWWRRFRPMVKPILKIQRAYRKHLRIRTIKSVIADMKRNIFSFIKLHDIVERMNYNRKLLSFNKIYSKFAVKHHCKDILTKVNKLTRYIRNFLLRKKHGQNIIMTLFIPLLLKAKKKFFENLKNLYNGKVRLSNLSTRLGLLSTFMIKCKTHFFLRFWKGLIDRKFKLNKLANMFNSKMESNKRHCNNQIKAFSKDKLKRKKKNELLRKLIFKKEKTLNKVKKAAFDIIKPKYENKHDLEYILTKYGNRVSKGRKKVLRIWLIKWKKTADYLGLTRFLPIALINIFHIKPQRNFLYLLNYERNQFLFLLCKILRTYFQTKLNKNKMYALFKIQIAAIKKKSSKKLLKVDLEQTIQNNLKDIIERKTKAENSTLSKCIKIWNKYLKLLEIKQNANKINDFSRSIVNAVLKGINCDKLDILFNELSTKKMSKDAAKVFYLCNKRKSIYKLKFIILNNGFNMLIPRLNKLARTKLLTNLKRLILLPMLNKLRLWKDKTKKLIKNYKNPSKVRYLIESMQPLLKYAKINKILFFDKLKANNKNNRSLTSRKENHIDIKVMVNNQNILHNMPINIMLETVDMEQNTLVYKKRTIHTISKHTIHKHLKKTNINN